MSLLPLLAAALAGAHPGPPVYLQLEIEEGSIAMLVEGEQKAVLPWFGVSGVHLPPVADDVQRALEEGARRVLGEKAVLAIDGVAVAPELERAELFESGMGSFEPTVQVHLRYACAGLPRRVVVRWDLFAEERGIPALFRSQGDFEFVTILPGEPEHVWHGRGLAAPRSQERRAPVAPPERRTLPLASLAAVLLGLAALPLARGARPRVAVVVLAGAAAFGLRDVARRPPPWGGRVLMPSEPQAVAMFEDLHRAIYAAFDARSEDEIYGILSAAVERDVLDELYGEVYESLVLRTEGGAFCEIESVTPLGHTLLLDSGQPIESEDDLYYEIEWRWRVDGTVTHWGHRHERTNVHRALYGVGYDGESWKITSWDVLEHRRADDGGELETLVGEERDG